MNDLWEDILKAPLPGRVNKPRTQGITMIIDKGLSVYEIRNFLEMNAPFIDFIKLSFGTTVLYKSETLRDKIQTALEYGIPIYPGGTLFEIALWQSQSLPYFRKLAELGFQWVEISDGTLDISKKQRAAAIHSALTCGLQVITEVGKKDASQQQDENISIETALEDLSAGACWVIIEARESGQGIGIYDGKGTIIDEKLTQLSSALPIEKTIWEAPLKNQQARLINDFGPNVNLGNIPPSEALALEALRLGYRSDTWKK
ncbi:MAG TPA: phosphosulfolactate synthase [Firmicutes bacterium]|jgi:phosphosulfolactate synthase|nr:phosphosulfolactate synthase [Bacillota bacterium]